MNLQEVAAEMLSLQPSFRQRWRENADTYALLVWIGRLYGYEVVIQREVPDDVYNKYPILDAICTRVDEPGARRRAEWMRNPTADPTYPPPVAWHLNGGPGIHPPGWHPDSRLVITPEVERSLYTLREQYKRMMRDTFGEPRYLTRPRPAPDLPPGPPPPPPPDTIAFPDEDRHP